MIPTGLFLAGCGVFLLFVCIVLSITDAVDRWHRRRLHARGGYRGIPGNQPTPAHLRVPPKAPASSTRDRRNHR